MTVLANDHRMRRKSKSHNHITFAERATGLVVTQMQLGSRIRGHQQAEGRRVRGATHSHPHMPPVRKRLDFTRGYYYKQNNAALKEAMKGSSNSLVGDRGLPLVSMLGPVRGVEKRVAVDDFERLEVTPTVQYVLTVVGVTPSARGHEA